MGTVWRALTSTWAHARPNKASRRVGIAGIFLGTLLGFEKEAFACLTSLDCSVSTPICNPVSMMCHACVSTAECVLALAGTVCVTSGPALGQCVPADGGASDAGDGGAPDAGDAGGDAANDGASNDGEADSGQDGAGGTPDAGLDSEADVTSDSGPDSSGGEGGTDGPGAGDAAAVDSGGQDVGQDGTPGPDGSAEDSGLDGPGNEETNDDVATPSGATDTGTGADADARSGDARASSEIVDYEGGIGALPDADKDPFALEGGGCACRASPNPASTGGLFVSLLGLALWVRRRLRP